jgi:hypothetical protein
MTTEKIIAKSSSKTKKYSGSALLIIMEEIGF